MNIFIKESLYLLDYNDNVLDVLFLSTDKDTPGQAYEINIKENNTGYSDLTFKMPAVIINEDGEKNINPKLQILNRSVEGLDRIINTGLVPLSKVRYERLVRYMGTETISFPGPNGETIAYPKNDGSHPDDYIIEDYIMDYIIQPLDKSRQSLKVDLTYTAIDYPRFTLSKKKLGFTTDKDTITTPELSIFTNIPMSVPGKVQYIPWTAELARSYQTTASVATETDLYAIKQPSKGEVYYVESVQPEQTHYFQYNGETWLNKEPNDFITWTPNPQSGGYPLSDPSIKKLIHETTFTNGILATIYYWPVVIEGDVKTARFEGVTYEEGSFITLALYNTYEGIESAWEGSEYLEDIAWDWNYLEPNQLYLNPNNACNLLRYILQNTNWSVANDGGILFKKNTDEQPWYTEEPTLDPNDFVEGTYYVVQTEGSGIRPYVYTIKQLIDGSWVDKTNDLLQYINTDEDDITNFGIKYDIDIEQKEVSRTAEGSIGQREMMDAQYSLDISNANCYNAITTEAKLFNLYPIFDCVNKTVTLKKHAGADYGLTYRVGRNLKSSSIKLDGEKVITKLYVTGGQDTQGSVNINLGEAVREVEGYAPFISSNTATSYINYDTSSKDLTTNMKLLQQTAYNNMVGELAQIQGDYETQELILKFPDTLAYETLDITPYNDPPSTNRSGFFIKSTLNEGADSSNLVWLYDSTSHCFYVYFSNDNYLDETKQLYKFDFSNIKVRRNLESWPAGYIGLISEMAGGFNEGNKEYVFCKTSMEVEEPNYLFLNDKAYVGYTMATVPQEESKFILDYLPQDTTKQDQSFVLAGPAQVYNADETTQAYTEGKYYYINDNYYYCAGQVNLQHDNENDAFFNNNGSLDYINRISINGYVFIDLGDGTDNLRITCSGVNYTVLNADGTNVTMADWLSSGYAIRVLSDGNILQEVYPLNEDTGEREFDPNAAEYLVGRSPYGTSYIYNFKYLYDNEWMTKEQILDVYRISKLIHADNLDFFNRYAQELTNARAVYLDAINNLELYESKGDAQLETLMSQYWQNPMVASKGKFSAFPYHPKKINISHNNDADYDTNKKMYKENITYNGETVKTVYYNVYGSNGSNYLYPSHKEGLAKPENPETEGQFHVVAKAIGWDTYSGASGTAYLALDETFPNLPEAKDPSDTITNYNKIISNMKLYYYKAKKANEELNASLQTVEELEEAYNIWQNKINNYEKYLQENYGQYIIEGSYNNPDQPYANLLLYDGLEASDLYAIPDVTYGVGVVDASGMIEYRAPQNLICNDLIKKLHGLGQIVPKSGDYVHIYDEEMGLFNVPGLITSINRRIDDPYQNALTIDTSYTDADELVGQIINATNTVLNNKDIYGRAAIIDSDGNLSTDTVTDALSTGKNGISITSTNGKIVVDNNGLTATNPENDQSMMRYNGTGVLGSSNGGITWRSLMTQDGINANYIDAGTINTTKVSVTNGQYDTVVLDSNGLTIKQRANQPYSIGQATENGIDWSNGSNVAVFVGKDVNNVGIGYFEGYIKATQGGEIAGWKITDNKLIAPNNTTYLSSDGDYAFYTESGSTEDGNLKYAGIKHDGTIIANAVEITGGSLQIGSNFKVTNTGALTAKSANITGTISTTNLTASGTVKINDATIKKATITNSNIDAANINSGTLGSARIPTLSANKISGGTLKITTKKSGYLTVGDTTTHVLVSGLTVDTAAGLDMKKHDIVHVGNVTLDNGSVGQNASVYVTTKMSYGSNYMQWYRGCLSFRHGIYIGYSEEGPYKKTF